MDDGRRVRESRTERLYKQALEQQAKRRAKAAEVDKNCTFKPRLVSKRRPGGASTVTSKTDRYLKLYEQAKVSRERLKSAREAPSDAECTFSPALVAKSSRHTVRRGNVFDNLYKKAVDQEAHLAEKRRTAATKECTFAPALNPPRKSVAPPPVPDRRASAGGRLYNPDWVRKRLDPEANDPDARHLDECTFAPKLVSKRLDRRTEDAGRGRAVFDKLYSDASKMESKRQEAAAKKLSKEDADCTFSPDLALTKGALESHMGGGAAHERLYRQAMDVWAKRSSRVDPRDQGCTFKPEISEASKQLSKNLRRTGGKDRFHEMYTEGLLRQKHRASEAQNRSVETSKDDEDNCTFHPQITPWPGVDSSPQMPVHERLYANAFNRVQARAAEEEVEPVVPVAAPAPPAMDGSRRYVQGGELYLI